MPHSDHKEQCTWQSMAFERTHLSCKRLQIRVLLVEISIRDNLAKSESSSLKTREREREREQRNKLGQLLKLLGRS